MRNSEKLTIEDRIYIFSKIYFSIPLYFAGLQSVPEVNLDILYKSQLSNVLAVEDRYEFGLLMMEFLSNLKSGYCKYNDKYITEQYGNSLGFKVEYYDGKWIVKRSSLDQLPNFEVINEIDGQDFEAYFQKMSKYICAFSEREARSKFYNHSFLFPDKFELKSASGTSIFIDRQLGNRENNKPNAEGRWIRGNEIAYLRLPSFYLNSEEENKIIDVVNVFKNTKALIIDLRDNEGGNVPLELIKTLMDRPFRFWSESTCANFGLFKSYGQLYDNFGDKMNESQKANLSMARYFSQPSIIWPASYDKNFYDVFKGKLYLLVDASCSGACEDFIIAFKDNKRATILGEKTMGSTGLSNTINFGNGINVNIATKKAYFPDGSSFDGIGIPPDIGIHINIDDLKGNSDAVLNEAIRIVNMFTK